MQRTSLRQWAFGASFCAVFQSLFVVLAGDYRLEVAARPEEFPPDPKATQRNYLHHQINNAGDILFSAHWRDSNAVTRSAIYSGPPGGVRPVVEGGDPVTEFPGFYFAGGPRRVSLGNFPLVTFNARGEVWFTGFIYGENVSPGTVQPFSQGFWKASPGEVKLVGATPDFNPNFTFPFGVGNVPYSGQGRLQWTLFAGFRPTDVGPTFFIGDIKAYVENVGLEFVLNQGLIAHDPTNGMRVVTYPGDTAPGTFLEPWIFESFSLYHVGHKNGALVLDATLAGFGTNANSGQKKRVFYHNLVPVYTVKDPLPDLPPLSEVLGTDEPFDLQSNLEGADGTGNFVFNVSASARNRIGGAPMGLWKWDQAAGKLVNVFRFQEPLPTPAGPVRLDTNVYVRAKIGNNRTVFVGAFTGLGYTRPTTGLFQENGTNFTLMAAAGMVVPGTNANFILGTDIGSGLITSAFWANESNEVLFAASFRTNATVGPSFQGMWAWRDGTLHSVIRAGQEMNLGDPTNRTIRAFGYSALGRVFNDLGQFMAIPTFTDGSFAIVRASPEAGEVLCCESGSDVGPQRQTVLQMVRPAAPPGECDLFTFTDKIPGGDWHAAAENPPTNWNDGRGQPHCEAPGDAAVGRANVVIDGREVTLDKRPANIGTLNATGQLILGDHLTLNQASVLDLVGLDKPKSSLTAHSSVSMKSLVWNIGLIEGGNRDASVSAITALLDFPGRRDLQTKLKVLAELVVDRGAEIVLGESAELISGERGGRGLFRARTGKVLFGGQNPGFASVTLENQLRKEGTGDFEIHTRFQASTPGDHPPIQMEIASGRLRLLGGGMFDRAAGTIASDAVLELQGTHNILQGNLLIGGEGEFRMVSVTNLALTVNLFGDLVLGLTNKGAAILEGGSISGQPMGDEGLFNEGTFFWRGGEIGSGEPGRFSFLNRGALEIQTGTEPRILGENFENQKTVIQKGNLALSGNVKIENESLWKVEGFWKISGDNGRFSQTSPDALFQAGRSDVVVDAEFYSKGQVLVESSEFGGGRASLRLNRLANIQNGTLEGGRWTLGSQAELRTPNQPIKRVEEATEVTYDGFGWPEFEPEQNGGLIILKRFLKLPSLVNEPRAGLFILQGALEVVGNLSNQGESSKGAALLLETGSLKVPGELVNDGEFTLRQSSDVTVGRNFLCQGPLSLDSGSQLMVSGDFLNRRVSLEAFSEAKIMGTSRLIVRSALVNEGRLAISGSGSVTVDQGMRVAAGVVLMTEDSKLGVHGDVTIDEGFLSIADRASATIEGLIYSRGVGGVQLDGGSLRLNRVLFFDQATLRGSGKIEGDVTIYGLTSPGKSPGLLTITGSLSQTNTSVTVFELAGSAPDQRDRLVIGQTAELGGTLVLNLLNGFRPQPADQFELLNAGALTGQFANAPNGSRLATIDGYGSFVVNYTATNVLLTAFQGNLNPPVTSPGRLLAPRFGFDSVELTLTGSPGRDYILQTSTNLLDWLSLLTNNASFGGQLRFELPANTDPYRFFRAQNK